MLRLPNVTICAADCVTPALAARALRLSIDRCEFGDAILFTDTLIEDDRFRCVRIAPLRSLADYSAFMLNGLTGSIATDYVLVVQWDGYVLEPAVWTNEFLRYDYIGARWPLYTDGMAVGNGGFSLRSRRLREAMEGVTDSAGINEDELICRVHRRSLETSGICFAPEALADRFSHECAPPTQVTFGFHGVPNMWRYTEGRELAALAEQFPPHVIRSRDFARLVVQQVFMGRHALTRALNRIWRRAWPAPQHRAQLLRAIVSPDSLRLVERELERLC
jgi:hypothetical protein